MTPTSPRDEWRGNLLTMEPQYRSLLRAFPQSESEERERKRRKTFEVYDVELLREVRGDSVDSQLNCRFCSELLEIYPTYIPNLLGVGQWIIDGA